MASRQFSKNASSAMFPNQVYLEGVLEETERLDAESRADFGGAGFLTKFRQSPIVKVLDQIYVTNNIKGSRPHFRYK